MQAVANASGSQSGALPGFASVARGGPEGVVGFEPPLVPLASLESPVGLVDAIPPVDNEPTLAPMEGGSPSGPAVIPFPVAPTELVEVVVGDVAEVAPPEEESEGMPLPAKPLPPGGFETRP